MHTDASPVSPETRSLHDILSGLPYVLCLLLAWAIMGHITKQLWRLYVTVGMKDWVVLQLLCACQEGHEGIYFDWYSSLTIHW